jgi:hypothetical protein
MTAAADGESGGSAPASSPPSAIGDLGRAFVRASRPAEVLAVLVGAVGGALVTVPLTIAIGMSPLGRIWNEFPAPWLSLSSVTFIALLVVVWTFAAIRLLPADLRPAFEVFAWAGERGLAALRAATGSDYTPTSPAAARRWLLQHAETEADRWFRVQVRLIAGDTDGAQETVARMSEADPQARWLKAEAAALTALSVSGDVDLVALRAAAETLEGEARLGAEADIAVIESRIAVARGGDWRQPLAALRDRIGPAADGILWRAYGMRRIRAALPLALALAIGLNLLGLLLGGA